MTYKSWLEEHKEKHDLILKKLDSCTNDEIIAYFDYENMRESEPDFCPLYAKNQKCHNMEKLNCYFCACPNFRFNDAGFGKIERKTLFSFCSINSGYGKRFESGDAYHQDCSNCFLPHKVNFVKKNI